MNNNIFIEKDELKKRTKEFAVLFIKMTEELPRKKLNFCDYESES